MEPVIVNGTEIPPQAIAREMQLHPAPSHERAWAAATTALVVRELLLQEAHRLGIAAEPDTPNEEESLVASLIAREVATPEPDEATCRRYWTANAAKFRAPDVYEAAHILFPAAPDDAPARLEAKRAAMDTLALLLRDPGRFAALARERSACPSGASGGLLGQQSRGDLVPELETFILELAEGQVCPVPVETRYGYHVLRLDRLARGSTVPFEAARERIERELAGRSWQRAVSQYIRILAGRARITGCAVDGTRTPLVQ